MRQHYFTTLLTCGFFLAAIFSAHAQTVIAERIADLQPEGYTITGQAFLREYDDGTVKLMISEDFDTPVGPDVRILLGPSLAFGDGVEIVNLSDLNHFSGALEVTLEGIGIEDYDFIVFFCVAFNQLWASGSFGESDGNGGNNGYECAENATATTNWVTLVDICPDDGIPDSLELRNNIGAPVGQHYAYLLTDTNEVLLEVMLDSIHDFEGSGTFPLRVYGINYDGDLNPVIGQNRMQTTASGCYIHSSSDLFLTITKNACNTFECVESLTATFAWVTNVDNCSTDGEPDEILIQNNIMTPPGDNYVFLLTDTNEVLQEIIRDSVYNFEGAGTQDLRVYGLSYDGELSPAIGENRMNTTASNCHVHSGGNLFLTIHQTAACATAVVDRALNAQITTYPNPAGELIKVTWPERFSPEHLQIVDGLGRIIRTQPLIAGTNAQVVAVEDIPTGTYLVRLTNSNVVATKRIQIIK